MEIKNNLMRNKFTKRPILITLLGILAILASAYIIVTSIPLLQLSGKIVRSEDPGVFLFTPIIPITISILLVVVGIGLLKMKKWLPRFLLALLLLSIAMSILSFIDSPETFRLTWRKIADLIINIAIVWYVFKEKKLFVN